MFINISDEYAHDIIIAKLQDDYEDITDDILIIQAMNRAGETNISLGKFVKQISASVSFTRLKMQLERYYVTIWKRICLMSGKTRTLDHQQQLMAITAEEAGELTQVCMKILRRGEIDQNLRAKLVEEIGDVMCMVDLMHEHDIFSYTDVEDRVEEKRDKLKIWSDLV